MPDDLLLSSETTPAVLSMHVSLAPFEHSHLSLLERWLEQSHVKRWYPKPASNIEWATSPPEHASHAIVKLEGQPIGYIRWQLVPKQVLNSIGLEKVPHNSADVDILIGNKDATAKGAGPAALTALIADLSEQGGIPMIGLTTSIDNTNAHKAFRKVGFENTLRYSPAGFGDCFLFTYELE